MFGSFVSVTLPAFVQRPGPHIEPIDNRAREEYCNDQTDEDFDCKEDETEEEREIFSGRESPNQGDVRHAFLSDAVEAEVRSEREMESRAECCSVGHVLAIKETRETLNTPAHDFRFSSRYSANLRATASSVKSTTPFSIVPMVIAFLCTVTNDLLYRCTSDKVRVRAGRLIETFNPGDNSTVVGPPRDNPWVADWCAITAEAIAVVVCSSMWSVSEGVVGT